MNSNLPLGAEFDPRAPFNNEIEDRFEDAVQDATSDVINDFLDASIELVLSMCRDSVNDAIGKQGAWEDELAEHRDALVDEVYDRVNEKLLKAIEG